MLKIQRNSNKPLVGVSNMKRITQKNSPDIPVYFIVSRDVFFSAIMAFTFLFTSLFCVEQHFVTVFLLKELNK